MTLPFVDATLALVSVGMGTMLPVTTVAVQNAVAPHEMGTATAAIGFFRQIGGALMVAAFGAIVLSVHSFTGATLGSGAADAASSDLVARFSWLFVVAAAAYALAFVLLLMMEERPLRGRTA
jgi:hypothetical protein